jgi:hypothetical protein
VGKAKRAHQSRRLVGTARNSAPLPTLQDIMQVQAVAGRFELSPFVAVVAEDIRAYARVT